MTNDELFKWIFGLLTTGLSLVVGFLASSVIGSREKLIMQGVKLETLEASMKELKENLITEDCVSKVIEAAFDKRDAKNQERRKEWDETRRIQTKEAVREEVAAAIPKIVQEVKVGLFEFKPVK